MENRMKRSEIEHKSFFQVEVSCYDPDQCYNRGCGECETNKTNDMKTEELKDQFAAECTMLDENGYVVVKGTPGDIIGWIAKNCLSEKVQHEWQICPKCNGSGMMWSQFYQTRMETCDLCNGKKIISKLTGQPPK